ncbi:MAG: oxidoreductase C-terminal domain-containing protein, partial [Pseudomonadota bacterium]|nr:oxidoreductase C-terminal domain-containing protein [Pseudomonadota bacterium]
AGRRENSVSVWSYNGSELVSVEVANDPQAYMIGKKCLEAGLSPAPSDIANTDLVLKSLLT